MWFLAFAKNQPTPTRCPYPNVTGRVFVQWTTPNYPPGARGGRGFVRIVRRPKALQRRGLPLIWSEIITLSQKIPASRGPSLGALSSWFGLRSSSSKSEMKYGNNKCMEQGTSREENAAAQPYAASKQSGGSVESSKHKSSSSNSKLVWNGHPAPPTHTTGSAPRYMPLSRCLRPSGTWSIHPRRAVASDGFCGGDVMLRERREACWPG